jgi:cytochrome bd-type quinol oxidase subunit 2
MDMNAFFGVVATIDFALLGLWWVTVQTRPDLRKRHTNADRMAYAVSLQFVVPGTAALLAQVAPTLTVVWRVSFAIAGLTGILAIVLLAQELVVSGGVVVARFLRFGALPLYLLMTFIALVPGLLSNSSHRLNALQVEAILFCLVIYLAAQVAWAAAMSPEGAANTPEPEPVPAPASAPVSSRGRGLSFCECYRH